MKKKILAELLKHKISQLKHRALRNKMILREGKRERAKGSFSSQEINDVSLWHQHNEAG